MDRWDNRPTREPSTVRVPLIRVRPGKSIGGIILADDLTGAFTHYWYGRTTICSKQDCEPCLAGRQPRWYGFLALYHPPRRELFIAEFTPRALDVIEPYRARVGSLRSHQLTLRRAALRQNSPIIAEIKPGEIPPENLPKCPDVRAILSHLWEIHADSTHADARSRLLTPSDRDHAARLAAAAKNGHASE